MRSLYSQKKKKKRELEREIPTSSLDNMRKSQRHEIILLPDNRKRKGTCSLFCSLASQAKLQRASISCKYAKPGCCF